MSRDSSGTYSRVVTPPVNGDIADADDFNAEINDLGAEMTVSLEASGKKTWTGNQNANGYGVKTLANTKVHTTAGGTTTYTVTTGATFTTYAQLPVIFVKANATNTGSMTVNVDGIGALTVKKNGATNLASGDFVQDYVYALAYDGTNLQLIGGAFGAINGALYQPLDATITALAALSWSSGNALVQFTAADTVSLTLTPSVTSITATVVAASTVELGAGQTDTTLARGAAGLPTVEGVSVVMAGKQSIPIPASAMYTCITSGAAPGQVELGSNCNYITWDFDQTTQERVQFVIAMPKGWNEGTVTFVPYWTAGSGTGGVAFALEAVALSDDDALNGTHGSEQASVDTYNGTANDLHIGPESGAITIAGSPAEGDLLAFNLRRQVGNASDTLTADAKLIAIKLNITTNAANDT